MYAVCRVRRPETYSVYEHGGCEVKSLRRFQTLTAAHGRRGEKEGWVYWYCGSPIAHPRTGQPFAFVGGRRGFAPVDP